MTTTTTREPVTTDGWYEHTDGTVGLYTWRDGRLCLDATVPSWSAVPSREERLAAQVDADRGYYASKG